MAKGKAKLKPVGTKTYLATQEARDLWGKTLEIYIEIIEASGYSIPSLAKKYGTTQKSVEGWLFYAVIPTKKSIEKLEAIVKHAKTNTNRIERHPSWGYATKAQIEQLSKPIHENERARIMAQIKEQTRNRGKVSV